MAQGSNEGGVLPAWTVTGASEAVNTPIWPPLHLHVSFELLQSLAPLPANAGRGRRARRGGARRWLAGRPLLRQTFRAAFQPALAPAGLARASTECVPLWCPTAALP